MNLNALNIIDNNILKPHQLSQSVTMRSFLLLQNSTGSLKGVRLID